MDAGGGIAATGQQGCGQASWNACRDDASGCGLTVSASHCSTFCRNLGYEDGFPSVRESLHPLELFPGSLSANRKSRTRWRIAVWSFAGTTPLTFRTSWKLTSFSQLHFATHGSTSPVRLGDIRLPTGSRISSSWRLLGSKRVVAQTNSSKSRSALMSSTTAGLRFRSSPNGLVTSTQTTLP